VGPRCRWLHVEQTVQPFRIVTDTVSGEDTAAPTDFLREEFAFLRVELEVVRRADLEEVTDRVDESRNGVAVQQDVIQLIKQAGEKTVREDRRKG